MLPDPAPKAGARLLLGFPGCDPPGRSLCLAVRLRLCPRKARLGCERASLAGKAPEPGCGLQGLRCPPRRLLIISAPGDCLTAAVLQDIDLPTTQGSGEGVGGVGEWESNLPAPKHPLCLHAATPGAILVPSLVFAVPKPGAVERGGVCSAIASFPPLTFAFKRDSPCSSPQGQGAWAPCHRRWHRNALGGWRFLALTPIWMRSQVQTRCPSAPRASSQGTNWQSRPSSPRAPPASAPSLPGKRSAFQGRQMGEWEPSRRALRQELPRGEGGKKDEKAASCRRQPPSASCPKSHSPSAAEGNCVRATPSQGPGSGSAARVSLRTAPAVHVAGSACSHPLRHPAQGTEGGPLLSRAVGSGWRLGPSWMSPGHWP